MRIKINSSLMETGFFDFNKMGIHQRLELQARFVINSNTISGKWKDMNSISVDEISLKGQLIDGLGIYF